MILDTAAYFAKTTIPSIPGISAPRRVPFAFTSTKRLVDFGAIPSVMSLRKENAQEKLSRQIEEIEGFVSQSEVAGKLGLSGFLSAKINSPYVSMVINPNTIRWSQPKRFMKRDTMEGSTFFHFTNKSGQNNDILKVSFSGKTGNINTRTSVDTTTAIGSDVKLRVWHDLYNLSREPILLDGRLKNEFFIIYQTVLFPIPLVLVGFFDTVLEFTETADQPFMRDYNFSFTVTSTVPGLDSILTQINNAMSPLGPISAIRGTGAF